MGMDVYGRAPRSATGTYFRNNVWWWHPLWTYCERIGDGIIAPDNLGHANDGWGLASSPTLALVQRLEQALTSGETERYAVAYRTRLAALPLEPCRICAATGTRAEPPAIGPGPHPCNACDGHGQVANVETYYPFATDNVREFVAFLKDSGGFAIY
ncbi:hypothetical protein [Pseudomonas helleri]|uniref:hypothetical protein n=1 Tax=Pseudomonas helleri TaxID=1608996 RepID=UPI00242BC2E6|nr:hypothetical protein [Pseudomonas helleri]